MKEKIACIVLPTYNEADNIQIIIPMIFKQQSKVSSHVIHVLVVDDDSPDGTAYYVERLMKIYQNLHVIRGKKKGLGDAYKRGISHAIDKIEPDVVFQMDADLQHSPELIPLFIVLASYGFSLVIGSRFALGGSTPDFSFRRRLLSLTGNWLLRILGGLPPIRDCTSGFRCIKANLLKKCDLSFLSTTGYSFQSSLLFALINNNANVIEIPIVFSDRVHGESKLSFKDQVEFLLNVFKLRFKKSQEFITFALVGISGVFVNIGIYYLVTRFYGVRALLAAPFAIEMSIISNFILNNSVTFRRRNAAGSVVNRFYRFHAVAGLAGAVNYMFFAAATAYLGWWDILATVVGICAGVFVNYFINARWTWKEAQEYAQK